MPDDPYADPVTGILRNKLGLDTAEDLAAAEREITQAALILVSDSPIRPTYDLSHLCAIHRTIFGDIYEWEASAAIMRGDADPMRKMLDTLVTDET